MNHAEASYFDGDHCQHCADRDEHLRLERKRVLPVAYRQRERRFGGRVS
jgi:hypothetical protein